MKKPNNFSNIAKLVFLSTVLIPLGTNLTLPSTAQAGRPWVSPDIDQEIKQGEKDGYEAERQELNENTRDAKDDAQEYDQQYYGLASDNDENDPGYSEGPYQVALDTSQEPKSAYASNDAPSEAAQTVQRIKVKDAILSCKIESTAADKTEAATNYTKVSYSVPQADSVQANAQPATGFTQISFMGNAKPNNSIKQKTYPETVLASITSMFPGVSGMLSMPGMPKELAVIASGTRTPLGAVQGLANPGITTANQVAGMIKSTKASLQPNTKPAKAPKSGPKDLSNKPPAGKTQKPQAQKCGDDSSFTLKCP